ncbi:hypothetical protein NHF40_01385 [Maricaulaceae bacterium EIL42A08]|nr:hypothetical protein [Maricaulaceae bacterium EIL42A08]
MTHFAKLAAAAGLAALSLTALPAAAEAQRYGGHHGGRWNGPEGHFLVYAHACPDLREDRRDRRVNRGRADRREDRRDARVLNCPSRAWEYVPTRRELRQGRTGERLRPNVAYLDRRSGIYYAETRWGDVPVYVVGGRGYRPHHRGYRDRHHRRGHRDHYGYRH